MKEEDKELLLKDFCGRLSYKLKVKITPINTKIVPFDAKIIEINTNGIVGTVNNNNIYCRHDVDEVKPYLFPLSSMTKEQKMFLIKNYNFTFDSCGEGITNGIYSSTFNRTIYHAIDEDDISNITDWLNKNYFDYRGLISMGLAIDATGLNIYKEETK